MSPSSQAKSSFMSTSSLSKKSLICDTKPIIGLDAVHHKHLQVHLHEKGKCILQQHQLKALLHYHQSHYDDQVWFFQIIFKVINFVGQTLSSQHWISNQHPASLPRSMTEEFQIQGNHLRRRESRRSLSARSGSSMSQGSFNTEFRRERERTSWSHSFPTQIIV